MQQWPQINMLIPVFVFCAILKLALCTLIYEMHRLKKDSRRLRVDALSSCLAWFTIWMRTNEHFFYISFLPGREFADFYFYSRMFTGKCLKRWLYDHLIYTHTFFNNVTYLQNFFCCCNNQNIWIKNAKSSSCSWFTL